MKTTIDGIVMMTIGGMLLTNTLDAKHSAGILIGWGLGNIIYNIFHKED